MPSFPLDLWTITQNPADYPGLFVARLWRDLTPTDTALTAPSLDALRAQLPPGLFCVSRDVFDDPVIVEVWI